MVPDTDKAPQEDTAVQTEDAKGFSRERVGHTHGLRVFCIILLKVPFFLLGAKGDH